MQDHARRAARRFFMARFPGLRLQERVGCFCMVPNLPQHLPFDVLDRLSVGLLVLDRRARILFANSAARCYGAEDGPLIMRRARLGARSAAHTQRLSALVQTVLSGSPERSMTIAQADGPPLTLVVSSIGHQDPDQFSARNMRDAAVLVTIVNLTGEIAVPAARVMNSFGLTAAEAKIALALASGASVPEAAATLGLSTNTVKTHLRKVFAKTGTSRQAELARVLSLLGLLKI